jgi:hemerythrin
MIQVPIVPTGIEAEEDLIKWDAERMATGVESVDEQHRELIHMLNHLDFACRSGSGKAEIGGSLDFLAAYVQKHFSHEENVMEEHRCAARSRNKLAHQEFLNAFSKLKAEFDAHGETTVVLLTLREIVAGWLTNHICAVDSKLRECQSACATPLRQGKIRPARQ